MKQYHVYIMTNKRNGVLYVGVTSNLIKRAYEHKHKTTAGFTEKYNLQHLVYFEETRDILEAIKREKQLKKWRREWKVNLIEEANPRWRDLYFDLI